MLFDNPNFADHEQVAFFTERKSGLRAIVAVHSTALGPAAGGCRYWNYASEEDAVSDVLRLSEAMSYKNALAGLPLGGGKSVILSNGDGKSDAIFQSFAHCVNRMGGSYYTAEDVGVGVADVELMSAYTPYVFGCSSGPVSTGDPSPFTALGGLMGIDAAVCHQLGRRTLRDVRVAVQGAGNVGLELCRLLSSEGARIWVSDINPEAAQRVAEKYGAVPVDVEEIYNLDVDVFAPCALGGVINDYTLPRLRCSIVAGVANNQLATSEFGERLRHRGILYAPDYVINAGGMLNASCDIFGSYDRDAVLGRISEIFDRALEIFRCADQERRGTNFVADDMARAIIASGKVAGTC
jgi:leucine dehydrogenase